MARFPRPAGTIESYTDLKVGDVIWEVYGSFPNCVAVKHPFTVSRYPGPFRGHPKWHKCHEGTEENIVFDTVSTFDGRRHTDMHFASDGNLIPGRSHNDNYWCRTREAAEAVALKLRQAWANDEKALAQFAEQRAWDRVTHDHYDPPEN